MDTRYTMMMNENVLRNQASRQYLYQVRVPVRVRTTTMYGSETLHSGVISRELHSMVGGVQYSAPGTVPVPGTRYRTCSFVPSND
jgi:hypothetical protein